MTFENTEIKVTLTEDEKEILARAVRIVDSLWNTMKDREYEYFRACDGCTWDADQVCDVQVILEDIANIEALIA